MIRVAMCDDQIAEMGKFQERVEACLKTNFPKEAVILKTYASPVELEMLAEETDVADVYILDVDMPGINGFKLAKEIQDRNAGVVVFFLTSHMEMASEGYTVNALRYIDKQDAGDRLERALVAAVQRYFEDHEKYLVIRYGQDRFRVAYSQIYYVEMRRKGLIISTRTIGEIRDSRGLKELIGEMKDPRFVPINRGTFVNADYVYRIESNSLIMRNEERLPVSRRLMSAVKESIAAYWSK